MNFVENRGCCVTVYREITETMREEERVKKQISRCIKMLFLGIIPLFRFKVKELTEEIGRASCRERV